MHGQRGGSRGSPAIGSAAALTAIDVWCVARHVIAPIAPSDAAAEVALMATGA